MKLTLRRMILAGFGLVTAASTASAGWNNVANVTCCDGPIRRAFRNPEPARTSYYETRPETRSSLYETRYEETSKFETVRVMKPMTVQEPVEVKVRSYYYEPVTTYTRRSYYDPCSGECQQIDVPRTVNVRRDEVRTETRFLERTQMVPVEMVREVKEETPVYTYRGPTVRKVGPLTPISGSSNPQVDQFRSGPQVGVERGEGYTPIRGTNLPTSPGVAIPKQMPKAEDKIPKSTDSRYTPDRGTDQRFNALSTSYTKASGAKVFGEVTAADRRTPVSNAKLVFVNATDLADRRYITADSFGGFDATLPAGEWIVYAGTGTGKADKSGQFTVKDGDKQELLVGTK